MLKKEIDILLKENTNNMIIKFNDISIGDNTTKKTLNKYKNKTNSFIQYSKYLDCEHENYIELIKYKFDII